MPDEQALGISDYLLKPVLMRLIDGLQQKSVEGVSQKGDVRIRIAGDASCCQGGRSTRSWPGTFPPWNNRWPRRSTTLS